MKTKYEDFEVCIPDLAGTGIAERLTVKIPLKWDEEVKQWLISAEANEIIENTKARHMGLLLPAQFKELRERYDYSQKEMGELFQVGEKSWTRWESGKHRPSRSISLLARAVYDGELSINYLLKRAGRTPREEMETALYLRDQPASSRPRPRRSPPRKRSEG
jgi:transcriptional regulator with XRE-family HTH domain